MSRVAKRPVDLPQGVTATLAANLIKVKGAKGELSLSVADGVTVEQQDKKLQVKFANAGARVSAGATRAHLANMVNEAALLAARKGRKLVTMADFNEAVERSSAGLEKKSRIMRDDEKLRVAYHEAGHALVAYSLPNTDPVHKVSIIPRGLAALGYTMYRPEQDRFLVTHGELESRIQTLLAGTVAGGTFKMRRIDTVSSGLTSTRR